jgi:hypothetical protein
VSVNALGAFWKAGWLIASNSMGVRLCAVAAWLTAAAVLLIAAIAARKLGPRISRALWPRKCAVIRIIPPADGAYSREAWVSFFRSLLALTPPVWKQLIVGVPWTTFEYRYAEDRLSVFCSCPEQAIRLVTAALGTALPGADVRLEPEGALTLNSPFVARAGLRLSRESLHPIGGAGSGGLESVIAGMTTAPESVLQIAIAHDPAWESKAQRRFDRLSGYAPRRNFLVDVLLSTLAEIVSIFLPFHVPKSAPQKGGHYEPPSHRAALPAVDKAFKPVFLADIRLSTGAPDRGLAKEALHAMVGGFRGLDGANSLRPRRVFWAKRFDRALAERAAPIDTGIRLTPDELAFVFHLPINAVPMESVIARLAPRHVLNVDGAVLCRSDGVRAIDMKIAQEDRRQHLAITGPTGSGKSALLLSLALQDVDAKIGVGAIDPKGDLISDLCERIPASESDRVVLIDPAYRDMPVGINILECPDPAQREVVCDALVAIFRKTYQQFWGPRTEDVLRTSVLTLMRVPGLTICEVPFLLLDDDFRTAITKDIDDPIGLRPFWDEYSQLSQSQRLQMVGPVLNKLRAYLLRPTVRNILGQSRSTINFADVINNRGILLVSLAKGLLGEDISRLLGAFMVARIWSAALGRIALPSHERPDFNLYLDEFQTYLHLPQSLDDVLAEARAYRLNLAMANQHYGQLSDSTRDSIDANARSRVTFQCGPEDARYLAREFAPLIAQQLQNLGRFQVAVSLCVAGHTEPVFTGITLEPRPALGELHAERIVQHSVERYGRPRTEVEAEMVARLRRFGVRGDFTEMAS